MSQLQICRTTKNIDSHDPQNLQFNKIYEHLFLRKHTLFYLFFLSSSSSSLTHYRISSLGIFSTMNGICFTKRTFACGCMDAWMLGCAQLMLPVLPHNSNSNNDSKMQHILYNSDHIIIICRYIKKYSLLSHSLFSFVPIIIILMLL